MATVKYLGSKGYHFRDTDHHSGSWNGALELTAVILEQVTSLGIFCHVQYGGKPQVGRSQAPIGNKGEGSTSH